MPVTATIEPQSTTAAEGEAPAPARRPRGLGMSSLFGACFALFAWALQLRPLQDNSFLWHLTTGHWILDHGIPRHDLFSFSAPRAPWVVQSWLAEVLYGAIDAAVGPFGLRLLRAAVSALAAFLIFKLAARLTGDRLRAATLTTAALAASFTLWAERPLLLGLLALVGLLWIVEVPDSFLGRRPLVFVPVLLWTWANVHGTFALGFAYLGAHLVGGVLDGESLRHSRQRTLLGATFLALGACLINPLGISLLTFPVQLLSHGGILSHVTEWRSPDFHGFIGLLFLAWLGIFTVAVAGSRRRPSRRDLLVSISFLFLGFWALRNVALAPIVTLAVVARAVAVHDSKPERRTAFNWAVLAVLVMVGLSATTQAAALDDYDFSTYPVKAMKVVEDRGLLGTKLMTTDAWSGYVIHEYWPKQQVFMDDRFDMFPATVADDYLKVFGVKEGWQDVLDRYGIQVVVWPKDKALTQVLDLADGWQRIYGDEVGGVWVRRDPSTTSRP
jgi:hypothetical protein